MTDSDITHLCPKLLVLYREWLIRCHAANLAVKLTISYRSAEEQNIAKAHGKSNASAGESPHNCVDSDGKPSSRAFDFACFDENAHYITDGTDPRYRQAGEIGKELGLAWGGDWNHPDWDHLELINWKGNL